MILILQRNFGGGCLTNPKIVVILQSFWFSLQSNLWNRDVLTSKQARSGGESQTELEDSENGGTPSHHPFINGFSMKETIILGYPHDSGNPQLSIRGVVGRGVFELLGSPAKRAMVSGDWRVSCSRGLRCTLWLCQNSFWKWPCTLIYMVIHSKLLVYQRVSLFPFSGFWIS